jgi:hypothetical protein
MIHLFHRHDRLSSELLMHSVQVPYRQLFESLLAYQGRSVYIDLLTPWLTANADERDWLRSFASRPANPIPPAQDEDLWRLYALSRVDQLLLLHFQGGKADGSGWQAPPISYDEYVAFARALSLAVVEVNSFSPFYHEIVEVEEAADSWQPVSVRGLYWPCLMLGEMLFSRAGVRVCGGRNVIRKEVAESSLLYWTFCRNKRRCTDLSHGWGSNSQWRTDFRRDYHIGQKFYYNVDGEHELSVLETLREDEDGLTSIERLTRRLRRELTSEEWEELVTNRCFILTTKLDGDLWPYEFKVEHEG